MHGLAGRRGGEVVHRAGRPSGRPRGDDHRGHLRERRPAPDAASLPREPRPPVRLLHAGHGHDGDQAAREQPAADRRGDPARARGQPVPLHGLREHRRGRPGRVGGDGLMTTTAEQGKGIGVAALRKEDRKFLTGRGRFVDDIKLPGMLHMAVVRSQMPHADITAIDTAAAAGMPGVTAVLTADDLEFAAGVPCASNPTGDMVHPVRWPLAKGRVRHVGEPIAVVLAADRYAARDAADAVVVDYAELPAVTDVDAALADGAAKVHDELDSNVGLVLAHRTDGIDAAFANADVVVEQTIRNQRLIHVPIETRGVVADWNPANDDLVVYSSTQLPHFLRTFLAIVCGVSEAKVRAIAPDVGGGFGAKLNAYAEEFIAAAVSRKVGAPVKWIEERSEAMLATCHGRAQNAHMSLARSEEGKVLAMRAHYVQ